jgi:ribosome-associated translation inhibitor RaiA
MELALVLKLSPENRTPRVESLVRRHLETKLAKIEARWGKPITARAVAEEQPVGFAVTLALLGEHEVVAKAFDEKLPKAVDAATDKLTRQFEILAEKREGRERNRRTPNNRAATEF